MHNEASCWKVTFPKGHALQYMISRVFIPPWSLVMGGRKLLDQTLSLREKKAGTLVFLLEQFFIIFLSCHTKVKFLDAPPHAHR